MRLKVCDIIVAEGEWQELAAYSALFLDCMMKVSEDKERQKAKLDAEAMEKLLNMTFRDLRKSETEDET